MRGSRAGTPARSNLVSRSKIKRDPIGSLFLCHLVVEPPLVGAGCGSGPGPRKAGDAGRQDTRDFYRSGVRSSVSETRCNGGAFRDRSSHPWPLLVWPSLAKQLPPGTTIAPLTGQQNRHGSAHLLRVSARTFRRSSNCASGPSPRKGATLPAGSQRPQ